ncbi:glucan endo-1,3-beta-glucosidase 12-like [Aristolochia californica]|uniref:glucan endo-1,3-beta-glucosidase 12-like n=1 Tax=Aristolochia californica TaxID=171875 RepID=UPI0035E18EB8
MALGFKNLLLPFLVLFAFTFFVSGDSPIGINYVDFARRSLAPGPGRVVAFLLRTFPGVTRVRLPDPNPETVRAFSYSGISLLLSIPNSLIHSFALNKSSALRWLSYHVVPFYPRARIVIISVGDNVVSASPELGEFILPAIANLHHALHEFGIRKISVSTTFSFDVIKNPFPPSTAQFEESASKSLVSPLLDFLSATNSSFLINLYPYHFFRSAAELPIGYLLFQENQPFTYREDPMTGLRYRNLFDMMIDAVITAMDALGRDRSIPVVVTETGWPSEGDVNEPEANEFFAGIYVNGLVRHLRSNQGTPLRREGAAATYIFELFDNKQKQGPRTERQWGILYPNLSRKYPIDFSGSERIGNGNWKELAVGFCLTIVMALQRKV